MHASDMQQASSSKRRRLNNSADGDYRIAPVTTPIDEATFHTSSSSNVYVDGAHLQSTTPTFHASSHSPPDSDLANYFLAQSSFPSDRTVDFPDFSITDPFLSPFSTPTLDDFALDPGFLESQEELRALLFTTAKSTAPTRAPSPVLVGDESPSRALPTPRLMQDVLSTPKRIEYLKNYLAVVAPWVRCTASDVLRYIADELPCIA
jgi:hypothetical protein